MSKHASKKSQVDPNQVSEKLRNAQASESVELINPDHFRVAIFGSARIKSNDPRYNQIERLARMIARAGMDVVTGGGPGLMEAANKGHAEGRKNGSHVHSIGLNIALPHEQEDNKHLDIKKEFSHFSGRLDHFMNLSNVVVVAPGGIGTLLELFYTWQLVQVDHICNTPIILLGHMWEPLMEWVENYPLKHKLMSAQDMYPIFVAQHCNEAMKLIKKAYQDFKENPDYCLNSRKYKIDF